MIAWSPDETAAIVRAARSAPVLCHEQPWVLETPGRAVEIREVVGSERRDPAGIDRLLSCGAALANVMLAVRAHGWQTAIDVESEPGLAARVTTVRFEPPDGQDLDLYRSIAAPDVVRRGHGGSEELHRLTEISRFRTARLSPVGGVAFAALLHDVSRQLDGDRRCAAELIPWQPHFVPSGPMPRRTAIGALADRLAVRPMFVVVTDSDTTADHVIAGAAMQIAMLAAPGLGFVPHPVVRPMHLRETRLRLMNDFALDGFPQALLGLTPAELNPWSQT
ncbi:MAG TPA: hypothetical protein VL652_31985 [Kutzneria sp.]|nr:hypothetical protein [Kutzneria sp.]